MNYCPKCRKKLVVQDFCVECGADLSAYQQQGSSDIGSFDFSSLSGDTQARLQEQLQEADFEIENGVLKKYVGQGGRVVIPRGVTAISDYPRPFKGNIAITEVIFEGSVQEIPSYAFEGCTSLRSIMIPEGTAKIGSYAFDGCSSLRHITIPSSVREIGAHAFEDCTALEQLQFNAAYATMCEAHMNRSFKNAGTRGSGINVTFGATVRQVPDFLFWVDAGSNCPLSRVTFEGNNCERIGRWAFIECDKLTEIWIPDSVREIGDHAFSGCQKLKSIRMPRNLTVLTDSVFDSCVELTSISLPDCVTTIEKHAFYACGLTNITLPARLSTLGEGAFLYCRQLNSITIPDGVSRIESRTFEGCTNLSTVNLPRNLSVMDQGVFWDCPQLGSVTIPSSMIEFNPHAFSSTNRLRTIRLPSKFAGSNAAILFKVLFPNCQIIMY